MVLTDGERKKLVEYLLQRCPLGKVKRGGFIAATSEFGLSRRSVYNIWQRAMQCKLDEIAINVDSLKKGRCGKKGKLLDIENILQVPLQKRTTIRSLAHAIGVSKSTIHKLVKKGLLKRHSNAIKPSLTEENMKQRLIFCMNALKPDSLPENPQFNNMFNTIHIDEKWFYITKCKSTYYILPHEKKPYRHCKSKRFIAKVMFLAAVARPRFNDIRECIFDGKLEMFPLVHYVAAKRKSKNRKRGTLELKPLTVINKKAYREMIINKLLPAIASKWPYLGEERVYLQQDNAKPHIGGNDLEFCNACKELNLDVQLINQPPNSPDMNILDLGFFRAIQSLKDQTSFNNFEALVKNCEEAFTSFLPHSLNHVFLTLQLCMIEVMKVRGSNNYDQVHVGKLRLERLGQLPITFNPQPSLVAACVAHLENLN